MGNNNNNNKPKNSIPKGITIPVIIGAFALSVYGNSSQTPKNTSKNYYNEINNVTNQVATISKEDKEIYTSFQNTIQNMISEKNEINEQNERSETNTTYQNTQKETVSIKETNTNKAITQSEDTKSQTQTNNSTSSSSSSTKSFNSSTKSNATQKSVNSTKKNNTQKSTSSNLVDQNATYNSTINKSEIVYKTKTGKKYHRYWCSYLRESKIQTTKGEAISSGLTPCKKCNP